MRVGDVWRSSESRTWLVTRFGGVFGNDTFAMVIDPGEGESANWPSNGEICLSSDRIASNDWKLVSELHT
jgi:hypothetical protein